MTISLTEITDLPTPPTKASPATFAALADIFLAALPTLVTETNAALVGLNTIISGIDQTEPIAAYNAGTTYNFPDCCAGTDGYTYRCIGTSILADNPVGSITGEWVRVNGSNIPVGTIYPYMPGYFTGASNGGFTDVLGNTVAAANSLLNVDGFYVCDGSAPNHALSTIWNAADRYLPNLTDDRFLMGSTVAGSIGGDNSSAHTHTLSHTHSTAHTHTHAHTHNVAHTHTTASLTLTIAQMPAHTHGISYHSGTDTLGTYGAGADSTINGTRYTQSQGGGGSHNHGSTGAATITNSGGASTSTTSAASASTSGAASASTTSAASGTENRPKFLSCLYIVKVH